MLDVTLEATSRGWTEGAYACRGAFIISWSRLQRMWKEQTHQASGNRLLHFIMSSAKEISRQHRKSADPSYHAANEHFEKY